MKKLKLILPMLVFILAIGMSFAYVKADNNLSTAYVYHSGTWTAVDVSCDFGNYLCRVQFVDGNGDPLSEVLDVYPIPSFMDENGNPIFPVKSSTPDVKLIEFSK